MWPSILAENICKGIGKLGELVLGPVYREKEYRDALRRAQAEKDSKSIAAGKYIFDGSKLITTIPEPDLESDMLPLMISLKEESDNLNSSINIAADILKDIPDEQISDEQINKDWFFRWRKEAQLINNAEMRQIWARILAEEIKSPQSISMITLDILRNITANQAEMFCKVARYRINKIIPLAEPFYSIYSIDDILKLENIGLVSHDSSLYPKSHLSNTLDASVFICNGFVLSINSNRSINASGINGCIISETGEEIINVTDNIPAPTIEDINKIGEYVWEHLPENVSFNQMKAYLSYNDGNQIILRNQIGNTWIRE